MDRITKAFQKFNPRERNQIKIVLKALRLGRFNNLNIKKLKGVENVFRIRKGTIRIIYQIRNNRIFVLKLEHRKESTYKSI